MVEGFLVLPVPSISLYKTKTDGKKNIIYIIFGEGSGFIKTMNTTAAIYPR